MGAGYPEPEARGRSYSARASATSCVMPGSRDRFCVSIHISCLPTGGSVTRASRTLEPRARRHI